MNIDNENTTVVIIDDDREFILYRCTEFIRSHVSVAFNPINLDLYGRKIIAVNKK